MTRTIRARMIGLSATLTIVAVLAGLPACSWPSGPTRSPTTFPTRSRPGQPRPRATTAR